jgi:Transglycosylase SLT domain/D-alanyl-D-alanine carboxypeptidase
MTPRRRARACAGMDRSRRRGRERGQASVLIVGGLAGLLIAALIVGAVARAVGHEAAAQRAADLAALAGARAMYDHYGRLFEPATLRGRPNPRHLDKAAYLALGRAAALAVGRANGALAAVVAFPDAATIAPVRIRVTVREPIRVRRGRVHRTVPVSARAEARIAPSGGTVVAGDEYHGPFAYRQGKPMRPDVALAFDRLDGAARADGIELIIDSAYRSNAEQAVLWAQHPDPKWVAPPGTSLHRLGTELDLGPKSAYPWLAANAPRFHFVQRYSWEPWHWGYTLNAQSHPPPGSGDGAAGASHGSVPGFVPPQYAPLLARAAQRWNVSAALLAAQLYVESNFNPFAVSGAGAEGIAQFMPGTAASLGLKNPFDAAQAIDAQAHLMRDLLRRFGSVPLALAAYNAGPEPVAACGCVPAFPETQGYVARIIGLMAGAGQPVVGGGLAVRLVA